MPHPDREALKKLLKTHVYARLEDLGFERTKGAIGSIDFRRVRANEVQLIDLQWEKYGRLLFVLNFGLMDLESREFEKLDVQVDHLATYMCSLHGRLQRRAGGALSNWFGTHRGPLEFLRTGRWRVMPEMTVRHAAIAIEDLERWWIDRQPSTFIYRY